MEWGEGVTNHQCWELKNEHHCGARDIKKNHSEDNMSKNNFDNMDKID